MNDTQLLAVLAPVMIINLILIITALVVCIRSQATRGPKWMWVLIILFVNLLGPILFFLLGRRPA